MRRFKYGAFVTPKEVWGMRIPNPVDGIGIQSMSVFTPMIDQITHARECTDYAIMYNLTIMKMKPAEKVEALPRLMHAMEWLHRHGVANRA